jgi:(p)ppGpp synthase/HD superfamily hydrolase
MLARAIEIASKEFVNVTDKSGRPYILHCLWVMNKVRHLGDTYMIVAVLHDLIEDTHWTLEMLREEGFSETVLTSLRLLTHDTKEPYDTYIKGISLDKIAREVKMRDLEHNTKVTRLKGLRKKDHDRIEKYHRAYTYLKE